ncbi:MAG: cytosine/adenosine deaminase-related metal-dependent hydrolase [Planctomycetota bacterium]|jgi:cytosine/adenosine deaminase-related metal-dependent hydrolase
MKTRIVTARGILPRADSFVGKSGRAGLLIQGGLVAGLLEGTHAIERARDAHGATVEDLGDAVLVPAFVNAHAHLELSGLAGLVEPGDSFPAWVGQVLKHRFARSPEQLAEDARGGLARLAQTGTALVGDIDSSGATMKALAKAHAQSGPAPAVVLHREVIDAWDPGRTAAAMESLAQPIPPESGAVEGYSPHAPYTVSRDLLALVAEQRRNRPGPVAVHWAEMEEELTWLESGTGPLAAMLGESPGCSGLDLLLEAGLLGPTTALIHGNLPSRGEPERIARTGATIVHCPGTHRYFDRGDFPLDRYLAAGVPIALGTDSLASNEDLDLLREARLLWARHPGIAPAQLFEMATSAGARVLGYAGRAGCLEVGAMAKWLCVERGPQGGSQVDLGAIFETLFVEG